MRATSGVAGVRCLRVLLDVAAAAFKQRHRLTKAQQLDGKQDARRTGTHDANVRHGVGVWSCELEIAEHLWQGTAEWGPAASPRAHTA